MSQLRAILIQETEKARKFKLADNREVWIPRSVTNAITKMMPDANGHREAILEVQDWFCDREGL